MLSPEGRQRIAEDPKKVGQPRVGCEIAARPREEYSNRSVHDQVSRNGWTSGYRPLAELSLITTSPNFPPNCAPQRLRSFLFAPLYSIENMCTPSLSIRLLTEGL